jgi:ABC-type enterochelin transport system substrate-binding protein
MKTVLSLLVVVALSATACANGPTAAQNASLQAEVNRCHEVMAQHETAIKVQDDAAIAYDWTLLNTEAAWNSQAATDARARLKAYMSTLADKAHAAYTNYTSK